MLRLVFDTSSPQVSLGLLTEEGWMEVAEHADLPRQQSKVLFKLIQELFEPFGIENKEITEIAVGRGPGSYTGLRMGITVAKVWAYAQKIPVLTFDSKVLLEKSKVAKPEAVGPNVGLLQESDFIKLSSLEDLLPVYENDHFEDKEENAKEEDS